MKVLFVMPKLGAWATHGHHLAPNQLYAHWAAYIREKGTTTMETIMSLFSTWKLQGLNLKTELLKAIRS